MGLLAFSHQVRGDFFMQKNIYVTIYEGAMSQLGISVEEYYIAETISLLSGEKSSSPGWCVMSKENMAKKLGVSVSHTYDLIKRLEDKGLIERMGKRKSEVRPTARWSNVIDSIYKNTSSQRSRFDDKSNIEKKIESADYSSIKEGGYTDFNDEDHLQRALAGYTRLFEKETGNRPILGPNEIRKFKEALGYISLKQMKDLFEDRLCNESRLNDALHIPYALSTSSINRWLARE
jgi:Transcriptional regulator of a riboflavin/FAD biosynthetic operon